MSTQSATLTVPDTRVQTETIAILLVSREAAVRSHLKQLLENEPDMSVIAEASHLDSARQHGRDHHPDVVVLALNTRGLPPLGVLRVLFSEAHATRYVVMNIEQDADQETLPDAIRLATSCELARSDSC